MKQENFPRLVCEHGFLSLSFSKLNMNLNSTKLNIYAKTGENILTHINIQTHARTQTDLHSMLVKVGEK